MAPRHLVCRKILGCRSICVEVKVMTKYYCHLENKSASKHFRSFTSSQLNLCSVDWVVDLCKEDLLRGVQKYKPVDGEDFAKSALCNRPTWKIRDRNSSSTKHSDSNIFF